MPEGPELLLSSLYINRTCEGRIFSGKVVKNPIHKCQDVTWNESAYTITAESRGKELMLHLRSCSGDTKTSKPSKIKQCSILFTFGMSGKFEFTPADSLLKHSHLTFFTKNEPKMGLAFVDYRRFGKWLEGGQWSDERGPCVIQDHVGFVNNVAANLNNSAFNKPICEVLLNQKFFNGVGNYLRAEILFRCKVPPFEKAKTVLQLKEHKVENNDDNSEKKQLLENTNEVKMKNGTESKHEKEERKPTHGKPNVIKVELPDPDNHCEIDLFVPKAQELLKLCSSVPLEVIDIGSTKYSLSELYKRDSEGKSFHDWLQCYYQDGMKNMADHNNRTIWFSGPAGPLAPKAPKVRGKKKTKANKAPDSEAPTDIDAKESLLSGGIQGKKENSLPSKLTRTKLKEYKQAPSNKKKTFVKTEPSENGVKDKSRKRKRNTSDDPPAGGRKVKKNEVEKKEPASRRLTRSSMKIEQ